VFDDDPCDSQAERESAKNLLGSAHDWGEIFSMLTPAERIDAAESLESDLTSAHRAGLVLYGALIEVDVRLAGHRDRWPVGVVRLHRMETVAKEQAARN